MGKPAARIGDMHVCPMSTGPVPHVGGPIVGPGAPTVMIGGMPAAVMGDMCTCVGPPDTIILGSTGVFIGGKPAARMGDQCAHGGIIVLGLPTVLIGEAAGSGGGALTVAAVTIKLEPLVASKLAQVAALKNAAQNNKVFCAECEQATAELNKMNGR